LKNLLSFLTIGLLSFNASALEPKPYYVVADDYIAAHLVNDHEKALVDFKKHVDSNGYKGSWRFYAFDDGRHVAFSEKTTHDYQAQDDKNWQEVADKFPKKFLQDNGAVYSKTITNQDFYLMRYMPEISYESNRSKSAGPSKHMIWLQIELHRVPVKKHITRWVKNLKESQSKLSFSTYGKQYGANLPTIFIVFHVDSLVDFYSMLEKKGTHDPLRLLPEEVYQGVEKYNVSLAKYIPEISY